MLGLGCDVFLVLAISDRSTICRPSSLFYYIFFSFSGSVVTVRCGLFSSTLVTCQLRPPHALEELCRLKRELELTGSEIISVC